MEENLPCIALTPGSCPRPETPAEEPPLEPAVQWRGELSFGAVSDSRMDGAGAEAGAGVSGRFIDGFMAGSDFTLGAKMRAFNARGSGDGARELVTFGGVTAPAFGNTGVQLGGRFVAEAGDFGESRGLLAARASVPTPLPSTQLALELGPEWVSNDEGSGTEAYYKAQLSYEPAGGVVDRLAVSVGRQRHAPSFGAQAVFNVRDSWGPLRDVNARIDVERYDRTAGVEYRQLSLGLEARVGERGPSVYLGVNAPSEAGQDGHQLVPVGGIRISF